MSHAQVPSAPDNRRTSARQRFPLAPRETMNYGLAQNVATDDLPGRISALEARMHYLDRLTTELWKLAHPAKRTPLNKQYKPASRRQSS
jgi:hypothetical protein